MKKIYKLILKSFAGPFFMTFLIVIFLLLMQFLWKYIDDLAGKGLEFHVLGELMFYVSASLVPLALPLAILLASLMTMGNLGENFELTAMKASGISLPRIVAPLIILSFFLTIGAFLFANYVLPFTNLKMGSLLYDITNQRPELQIREGIFYNGIDDYSLRITRKNYKTNMLYGIKIYNHQDMYGNVSVTLADSGVMRITTDKKYLIITLYDGISYEDDVKSKRNGPYKETYPFSRKMFKKQEIVKQLVGYGLNRTDESLFRQNYRMLSLRQLRHHADSLGKDLSSKSNNLQNEIMYSMILRFSPVSRSNNQKGIRPRPVFFNEDTAITKSHQLPIINSNADSLLVSMRPNEQLNIISEALSYARDTKTYISSNAMNTDDKARALRKYDIEWWKKFTMAVSCIIFFLIGAPLGAIIRKGGFGMPVVISVLFFVVWYILSLTSEKFVREGLLPSVVGMWAASVILLITGIFLTRKATMDSTLFNIDTYLNPVKLFMNKYMPKKYEFKEVKKGVN